MKDFEQLQKICLDEVRDAGIQPGTIVSWEVNSRAKTRWGMCTKVPYTKSFKIQIAYQLLADDRVSEKSCKETIIHEILHTCAGCQNHGAQWKYYASVMNQKYGYEIKRVTAAKDKGLEANEYKPRPYKYMYRCRKCGQLIRKKHACKFTKYYRNYSCGICGAWRAFRKVEG